MKITMAHGAGGELTEKLVLESIVKYLRGEKLGDASLIDMDDGASLSIGEKELIITTDGHTITPIFFPGGDIGRLAACGTINDVSVMGAKPLALASSIIVEEGFLIKDLERITRSMDEVCREAGISIVTGDTKVMEKGKLDNIVVTTTGIGIIEDGVVVKDSGLRIGDKLIVSGTIGDHGISLMSFREGFGFETTLKSDIAPVWPMVKRALKAGEIHAMKDPTRGGLAAALNEFARKSGVGILIDEDDIPLKNEVVAASEMLGIDPFTVANEGKVIFGIAKGDAEEVLKAIRSTELGRDARIMGEVIEKYPKRVILETVVGGRKIMEMPIGDPIPRVC
ncbi:MAG: hydrogenase expression/formation protein HypE [Candidatus Hydrothermarchaeales archaeon]